jgi:hypothetical protein
MLYFDWLPKGWKIVHKMSDGFLDLQTTVDDINALENLVRDEEGKFSIAKTGKSFSIRQKVPPLKRQENFDGQKDTVKQCLDKVTLFNKIRMGSQMKTNENKH